MKRSDRHKTNRESQDHDLEKTRENMKAQSDDDKARSNSVKNDKLEQGKKFVSTKLSAYNTQLKKENKILKEKFTNFRSGNREQNDNQDRKRPIIPIIVTGILLLPITILLAFLLITNFLPDETDTNRIASNDATEDTEEESTDEETDTEDSETISDETDVATDDEEDEESTDVAEEIPEQTEEPEIQTTADYSSAQRQQLQRAAQNAVNEKNAELAERREQEALARQRAAEEEARRQAQAQQEQEQEQEQENEEETEDTDSEETPSAGGQVHTVTGEDNLYRIAIQYYGDGSAANIQRIREANGISGDNLEVGQTLTIP